MMRLSMNNSLDDDESAAATAAAEDTPLAHSPPSGAESLFLAGLTTSRLSRMSSFDSRSIVSGGGRSVMTDDFMSCLENPYSEDLEDPLLDTTDNIIHSQHRLLSLQIPEHDESITIEQSGEPSTDTNNTETNIFDSIMSTFYSNSKYSTATSPKMQDKPKPAMKNTTTTASSSSGPDLSKIDAAEVVYAKAKDVWAWGKTVPVVSIFVGTTETVANKACDMAGTDFSSLDTKIAEELAKLDTGVLNPALEAVAKAVISAAAHSEETLKPIILQVLSTVGMIKSEANEANPEAHTPEVTTK
ncbi:MAG: hypothetical protein SGARI_004641 [Bacillariaceae sp.]